MAQFIPQPNMELMKMALDRIINRPEPLQALIQGAAQVGGAAIQGNREREFMEAEAVRKQNELRAQQDFELRKTLLGQMGNLDISTGGLPAWATPGVSSMQASIPVPRHCHRLPSIRL